MKATVSYRETNTLLNTIIDYCEAVGKETCDEQVEMLMSCGVEKDDAKKMVEKTINASSRKSLKEGIRKEMVRGRTISYGNAMKMAIAENGDIEISFDEDFAVDVIKLMRHRKIMNLAVKIAKFSYKVTPLITKIFDAILMIPKVFGINLGGDVKDIIDDTKNIVKDINDEAEEFVEKYHLDKIDDNIDELKDEDE